MTNETTAAFDAIAALLDEGIEEFETRFQIIKLCGALDMNLTDFADGLHDEMMFTLTRGSAETELVYTYMPGESHGYDHRYDLTEKHDGEPARQRRWETPSATEMQMTPLSTHRLK